jgi:inner membrane protein
LSPFNWLIIVSEGERHHVTVANLAFMQERLRLAERLGWLGRLWAAYRPPQALAWITHHLRGSQPRHQDLAEQAWRQHAFDAFRRFAKFPALYRIDRFDAETCVWFTDLRYVLPGLTPPFRYGMCRSDADLDWELYRLRRFTHDTRHFLGDGWTGQ